MVLPSDASQSPPDLLVHADDDLLTDMIQWARDRIVFIAPAVHRPVGEALMWTMSGFAESGYLYMDPPPITIVLDIDEEVYRLGYGDAGMMRELQQEAERLGVLIHRQPGVRVGVLIADAQTLVFSPQPELIAARPDIKGGAASAPTAAFSLKPAPNALRLGAPPPALLDQLGHGPRGVVDQRIGQDPATKADVDAVHQRLTAQPPLAFDVTRQMLVFNSAVEFVEWEVKGLQLDRRRVPLPSDLFLDADPTLTSRLETHLHLIDREPSAPGIAPGIASGTAPGTGPGTASDLESASVEQTPHASGIDHAMRATSLQALRQDITRQFLRLIPRYGYLIERRRKPDFDQAVEGFKAAMRDHRAVLRDQLQATLDRRCEAMHAMLMPLVMMRPPSRWGLRNIQVWPGTQTFEQACTLRLREDLRRAIRCADDYLAGMETTVVYKAVTYETLCEPAFLQAAHAAFPHLQALHTQTTAARTTQPTRPPDKGWKFVIARGP